MKKAISFMLATLMVLSLVLTGCSGTKPSTNPSEPQSEAQTQKEKRTDINLQLYQEPTHLDPHYSTSTYDMGVMYQIYDNLFEIINGDYDHPQPSLCETFDVNEGATEVDGMPSNRIAIAAEPGGVKTLRVVTIAPENEQLTYKWSQGPLNDSGWWPLEQGQDSTTNELTINLDTAQRYLCVVSDTHGNQALSYFYVNVGPSW